MTIRDIYDWLCSAPMLEGEKVNLDFLPAGAGWSMSVTSSSISTDILGTERLRVQINIIHRYSVSGNADRLAIIDMMDNLRFWAKQNPPDGCRVILAGMSKPKSKSASGTEDFVLTMRVEES